MCAIAAMLFMLIPIGVPLVVVWWMVRNYMTNRRTQFRCLCNERQVRKLDTSNDTQVY
jgi:hypothetical protein